MLLSTVVKDAYISYLFEALANADDAQKMAAWQQLVYLDVLCSAVNLLYITIFDLSFAGTMRTVRQYEWISSLPNYYSHILGGVCAVLPLPASLLAWNLFCYDQFDRHFNPLVCPELIGKGITHESETP